MRSVRLVSSTPDDGPAQDDRETTGTDGEHPDLMILETADGEKFSLELGEAERAALRSALGREPAPGDTGSGDTGPTSAATAGATSPDSPQAGAAADDAGVAIKAPATKPAVALSPREIQVRVRAGESPEDLAEESGNALDRIMRFASAVLQERSRIGDEARRARARRDGDGGLVPFGETVDRQFVANGIDAQSVTWDAYRRPDGTWVVVAAWTVGGSARTAHWAFALAARTLLPADETASDLLSEHPLRPVVRAVTDQHGAEPGEAVYDQETSGYTQARPERSGRRSSAALDGPLESGGGATRTPPTRTATRTPPTRTPATREITPIPALDQGTRESEVNRSEEAPEARRAPSLRLADPLPDFDDDGLLDLDVADLPTHDDAPSGTSAVAELAPGELAPGDDPADPAPEPANAGLFETDAAEAPQVKRGNGRGRAAREQTKIPSWDDILLGVRRRQD